MTYQRRSDVESSGTFIKTLFSCLLLALLFTLQSCGDGDDGPSISTSSLITFNRIFDVGNEISANDIYISFQISNTSGISELRAIIVKSSDLSSLDNAVIIDLQASAYTSFNVANPAVNGRLNSQQTDIQGNALVENTEYQILIYDPNAQTISSPSDALTLTNVSPLTGEYAGTWDDNIYTNFGISAKITGDGNTYTGDFYYSANFAPCCGGATDGDISFTVTNDQIADFFYDQDLITYMNGCPGEYRGSGGIQNEITLRIDFTGDDCDGHHTGGIIRLTRVR